jgi:hypothetical protein
MSKQHPKPKNPKGGAETRRFEDVLRRMLSSPPKHQETK